MCLLEKGPSTTNNVIKELKRHNEQLQSSLDTLNTSNSQYLCEILIKNQLICEIHK